MSAETVVWVELFEETGWWQVRHRYPGMSEPHTLLTCRTREEAERAAEGYSIKYGWTLEKP